MMTTDEFVEKATLLNTHDVKFDYLQILATWVIINLSR